MKNLLRLLLAATVAIIAITALLISQQSARHAALIADITVERERAAAIQAAARAQVWTQFVGGFYDLLLIFSWAIAGLLVFGIATAIYIHVERARLLRFSPTDNGLFPLQRIAGALINPNLSIYPQIADNTPATVPVAAALAAAESLDRVRISANMSRLHLNAAGAKLLAGGYDRQPAAQNWHVTPPAQVRGTEAEPEPQRIDLAQAWQQSSVNRWLLGQSDHGATYALDMPASVHVGLLGATGTGKTSSTALMIALAARRHGWQVIVLDGKGGIDWQPYAAALEVWPADYTTIGDQLAAIERLHRGRMATLRNYGAPNIGELTDIHYPNLLVIVEEYGHISQSLRAADGADAAEKIASLHSNLMRVSRATGVHFLLVDQSPQGWPGVIRANVKTWIAYHLGGGQAAAINMYATHKLPKSGAFMTSDDAETVYRSWHTASHAAPLLRQLPPSGGRIINAPYSVREGVSSDVFPAVSPEVDTPPGESGNKWDEFILAYMVQHIELWQTPPRGIRELAREMSRSEIGNSSAENSYVGIASKTVRRFRDESRLNGNVRFGYDLSTTIEADGV